MKKVYLLIFVPTIAGYFYNMMVSISFLGTLLFYVLPPLMIAFWFWVGSKFAESRMNILSSVLVGNSLGIVSLLIYIWQFILVSSEQRNLFLAGFSQMFTACVAVLTAPVAIIFEADKNSIGQSTFAAMQVLGLVLMIAVFVLGYLRKRAKIR